VASSTNPLSGIDPEAEGKEKAMAKGKSFDAILADAETLIRVWTANPTLSLGDVTRPAVEAKVAAFKTTRANADDLRTQLTKAVNDVNDQADELASITVRGRSGVRAQFGPDSAQYDQVGGTRASERKPRKLKGAAKS
jgi:hypothetical protein